MKKKASKTMSDYVPYPEEGWTEEELGELPPEYSTKQTSTGLDVERHNIGPELGQSGSANLKNEARIIGHGDVAFRAHNKEGKMLEVIPRIDVQELLRGMKESHLSAEKWIERYTKDSDKPIHAKDLDGRFWLDVYEE